MAAKKKLKLSWASDLAKKGTKTKQYRGLIDKWAQDRVKVRDTPAKKKK